MLSSTPVPCPSVATRPYAPGAGRAPSVYNSCGMPGQIACGRGVIRGNACLTQQAVGFGLLCPGTRPACG